MLMRSALLIFMIVLTLRAQPNEKRPSPAAVLAEQGQKITLDAEQLLKNSSVETLRAGTPMLVSSLGPVHLRMTTDEVEKLLGKPAQRKDSDYGASWRYDRKGGKTIYVVFDQELRVTHVSTDSNEFQVPNLLTVGTPLQEFETLYGTRSLR